MTVYFGGKYLKTSREVLMPRRPMDPTPVNSFALVYDRINSVPGSRIDGLVTTGGVGFSAEASVARDGRKFIALPHNNRIYEQDWGFSTNSMGKGGQWIGHYARPLDDWCSERT